MKYSERHNAKLLFPFILGRLPIVAMSALSICGSLFADDVQESWQSSITFNAHTRSVPLETLVNEITKAQRTLNRLYGTSLDKTVAKDATRLGRINSVAASVALENTQARQFGSITATRYTHTRSHLNPERVAQGRWDKEVERINASFGKTLPLSQQLTMTPELTLGTNVLEIYDQEFDIHVTREESTPFGLGVQLIQNSETGEYRGILNVAGTYSEIDRWEGAVSAGNLYHDREYILKVGGTFETKWGWGTLQEYGVEYEHTDRRYQDNTDDSYVTNRISTLNYKINGLRLIPKQFASQLNFSASYSREDGEATNDSGGGLARYHRFTFKPEVLLVKEHWASPDRLAINIIHYDIRDFPYTKIQPVLSWEFGNQLKSVDRLFVDAHVSSVRWNGLINETETPTWGLSVGMRF